MYGRFLEQAADTALAPFAEGLAGRSLRVWNETPHGELPRWRRVIEGLPRLSQGSAVLDRDRVGVEGDVSTELEQAIRQGLMELHPWRKGPFQIHGVQVDAEWRSDLKWSRLAAHIAPLRDRLVLDVGCGNGYYAWRMRGAGARLVVGIDPTQLFIQQFEAIRHFLGNAHPVHLLPLGIEDLPGGMAVFDTVFSMGVFYHRRSPMDHLLELRGLLRSGGQLVLETLVIAGGEGEVLVPAGRYAKMRNVWFIPTPATLVAWLVREGFRAPRVVEVTPTTPQEQRATDWMRFESLADYLDPGDPGRTVEGHPAPARALILAEAP
ncbi:MAG: tRNA 5-methoxyuridine(34)/uridine 5-oxyacetic acid(34) synthase CmoB [Gammaproteobacteria bacterium]|nr:tRNA 5-methoxyuridine(34)/uridine 5-oxyacetic acid(34) synthase CmoB [Gammaproteobacteria bacterium]MBU1655735.1 tRNA 5-methoxyuridine(34)/uridine 5-oxyacetic acid(34) synthase CmoB [Gammaproteobacteria bacterium]MBU1960107.1 tRNA 5-methoxyuridine(34)/uridine 5-oxyacetic acid(34) synthase CmoB [Gammaproteobacteria bacterium]